MPNFTTLKALVSMINSPITLTNHSVNDVRARTLSLELMWRSVCCFAAESC